MKRIPASELDKLMSLKLKSIGTNGSQRKLIIDALLETSLRGVDTHGVALFKTYCKEIEGGRSRLDAKIEKVREGKATALIDANGALGILAGMAAVSEAISLAEKAGVGVVSVRNSNHFGAVSVYLTPMARANMIGLCFSNADSLVAPAGGIRPFFGSNPMGMAVEGANGDLFCLDFSIGAVSYSKLKWHVENGSEVPLDWAIDGEDGKKVLLPFGGYKGQALAMMVEILCAGLSGGRWGHELSHLYDPPYDVQRETSHTFMCIDISSFQEIGSFKKRVSTFLEETRRQPADDPDASISSPGDLERRCAKDRIENGIPVREEDWIFLSEYADTLGANPSLDS